MAIHAKSFHHPVTVTACRALAVDRRSFARKEII